MKSTLLLSTVLAFSLITHVKGNDGEDEKEEMKRTAEQYRKCAEENKSAKLSDCDAEAPERVKNAAAKAIELRHKVGEVEEKLATAYEAGDKKLIHQLHDQKNAAELDAEFSDKEKRVAYVMSNVDEMLKSMPDSPDAKGLKAKTEANMKAYLDNAKKLIELQKEQMRLEKGIESVDSSIEILRKREELKKLEEEAVAQ
jgi:hypothetical protein